MIYGVNLPVPLTEGTFGAIRVTPGPPGPFFLLQTSVLVLLTPVLAIEAIPLGLALHLAALTALYAVAFERWPRLTRGPRLTILVGLGFAITAPFPELLAYPSPFNHIITLFPPALVPLVRFFGGGVVLYGFPFVAYALPILALALGRPRTSKGATRRRLSPLPAYLLPAGMFGGMLLVIGGTVTLQVIGLILNWALMVAALLLWVVVYRPALSSLRVPPEPTRFERRLYAWRRPTLAFVGLTLLLLLLTGLPVVDEFIEASALGHHAQHVALFVLGLLLGAIILQQARAYRRARTLSGEFARFVYTSNMLYNPRGAVGAAFAVTALALWHVPYFWDWALTSDAVHVTEHFFVIAAGSAVAFSLPRMPVGVKYALFVTVTVAMSVLALTLWSTRVPIYGTYSVEQLMALGMVHFLVGMPLMIYAIGITATAVLRERTASPAEEI